MLVVLKRGAKLFAVSAAVVVAMLGLAYFVDLAGAGVIRRWIFGGPDQEEPVLYIHVIMEDLVGLLLLYFVVCLALAWCWTWIKARTTNT